MLQVGRTTFMRDRSLVTQFFSSSVHEKMNRFLLSPKNVSKLHVKKKKN